jgi:methylenetetrahydrofolate reductase (NADPH)
MLVGAAAHGLHNVLVLRGDNPEAGDQPDAKPVFDLDSNTLLATADGIRDRGELPNGRAVAGKCEFFLGAADSPIDPPPDWRPEGLMRKLKAGAQFVQTQFCLDPGVVRRYLARLAEQQLTDQLFFLIGLAPLASARSARWIRQHLYGSIIPDALIERLESATDQKREGVRICVELMQQLQQVPGVAGVHLMAPLNSGALAQVIGDFRAAASSTRRAV